MAESKRKRRGSLLSKANITPLDGNKIYTGNVVLTSVDMEDRSGKNGPLPKMIFLKFSQLDSEGKRAAEAEVSWWKLKTTAKNKKGESMFFPSLRELLKQLVNVLSCYMDYDEACEVMDASFKGFSFETLEDAETYKWKTKDAKLLTTQLKKAFSDAVEDFVGVDGTHLNLKLVSDQSGDRAEVPRYGNFVEVWEEGVETSLKFSAAEEGDMKQGNTEE